MKGRRGKSGDAYFDELGLHAEHLLPAIVPHVVAAPGPVLAVLGELGVEPGGHGHHVGFGSRG